MAIRDVGGLEVLINLLDTEEVKCKVPALKTARTMNFRKYLRHFENTLYLLAYLWAKLITKS